jgi:hypothetical protein
MAPTTRQAVNPHDTAQVGPSERPQGQTDQEIIAQLRAQIEALTAMISTPEDPVARTIERDTSATITTITKYSKKRPDPPIFTDGVDPTFESWKIQIQAKLRANTDHYPTEEDKMEYVFSRTLGDAQRHLLPRFDEDSPIHFVSFREMLQHLASIYINPNKVRDAQYEYRRLRMDTGQTFATFQTKFLHLAGEGQVPQTSYRLDLFDKLPAHLQRMLLPGLDDLVTYEQLSARCLTLDTGLRRIEGAKRQLQPQNQIERGQNTLPIPTTTSGSVRTTPPTPRTSPTPEIRSRHINPGILPHYSTPIAKAVICYRCDKLGHFASQCPKPDSKATEEEYGRDQETEDNEGGDDKV